MPFFHVSNWGFRDILCIGTDYGKLLQYDFTKNKIILRKDLPLEDIVSKEIGEDDAERNYFMHYISHLKYEQSGK